MIEIFQDSMAIIRFYKHLDIFMIVISNPRWSKIQNELLQRQQASDKLDLIVHVFELKRYAIMKDIKKRVVFGHVVAHVYTIEFQKKDLFHMYILIFLNRESKIRCARDVDHMVSADFLDKDNNQELFEVIL